ncbi:MAG: Na+/H+ antiporter NhaC family protein [Bacteroidales bacterium]|nr:Na+/H+ antiporter NhaC family protein [Bacteroidales bacterium]
MSNEKARGLISLIPVVALVAMLALNINIFGSDAILGASQVALLVAAGLAVWLSMWLFKTPWKAFEDAIKGNIGDVTTAIVILLLIGAISGTWMASGIVPTFICYGIKIISPKFFLLTACLLCALISVMIGSSWTTIATIGVALIGIGKAEGFSDGLIAGAIISGAYFGDKISPLSDTTVMASSVCGVPLFAHIKNLMRSTVPSMVVALIAFTVLGFTQGGGADENIVGYTDVLQAKYNITPWLLIVPVLTGIMIARRMPAIMVLALSTLLAGVFAVIFQADILREIGGKICAGPDNKILFTGLIESIYNSVGVSTGSAEVDSLVASRGMTGMLNTVYLIICAMCFGGCMRASGMIKALTASLVRHLRKKWSAVAATVTTGTALNGIVSDQYLAILLTSNIYKDVYESNGLDPKLLSRSVEDSATVTSPLFPWSSCGMTQATILGVPTLVYLPFCFFNYLSPFMSIIVSIISLKKRK